MSRGAECDEKNMTPARVPLLGTESGGTVAGVVLFAEEIWRGDKEKDSLTAWSTRGWR